MSETFIIDTLNDHMSTDAITAAWLDIDYAANILKRAIFNRLVALGYYEQNYNAEIAKLLKVRDALNAID